MNAAALQALKTLDKAWRTEATRLDITGDHKGADALRECSQQMWIAMHAATLKANEVGS